MSKRVVSPEIEAGKNIHDYSTEKLSALGIVGVVGFPLYYFVWHDLFPQPYEDFALRMIGTALCIPLVFCAHWPKRFNKYRPAYWDLTLLYSLPFFFTYMLLKNEFNQAWSMSTLVAIFIIMLLATSWKNFVALFFFGSFLGWLYYAFDMGELVFPKGLFEYLAVSFFAVIVGSLLNYRSYMARLKFEKLQILVAANGNIAHELRTPLLSIKSGLEGLNAYMPVLLETYQQARQQGLDVPKIRKGHDESLADLSRRISKEVDYANTVIDMLLVSSNQESIQAREFKRHSIRACIQKTLERYPFNSEQDKQRVHLLDSNDFTFIGSDVLMVHILFNLLKNAFHAIAVAGKGEISISLSESANAYHLHFRDTGIGIDESDMSHIFERFYTTSKYGHGVGLSYCSMVMQSFGGNIECSSRAQEYTEFQLNFPKQNKEKS